MLKMGNFLENKYRVTQKKCPLAFWSQNLFQESDFTFPYVFQIQNFEPDSSSNSKNTHSESEVLLATSP